MKKIYTLYLSFLLVFSLFIITWSFYVNQIDFNYNEIPVSSIIKEEKVAHLTFDDGPSENTTKILDILDKYDIQATFFVVGPSYKQKNNLLKEIVNRGHVLAIHSYNHEYSKIYNSKQDFLDDFYACLEWIKNITGTSPKIYRFPGGSSNTLVNKSEIQSIISSLNEKGFKHVDWNVDSFDSHYNSDSNAIIKNTLNGIKLNESNKVYNQTLLLHDNTKKIGTISALASIIENILSKGYQFKTLNENSNLIQHVKKPQ